MPSKVWLDILKPEIQMGDAKDNFIWHMVFDRLLCPPEQLLCLGLWAGVCRVRVQQKDVS